MIGQLPILTDRQLSLLTYLYKYLNENRYMPTRREIAQHLDLNSDNSTPYVNALIKKGYLQKTGERARRNIVLTEAAYEKLSLENLDQLNFEITK